MLNTMKPNYFVIQPIVNKKAMLHRDGLVEQTNPITSINSKDGYEIMDHIFYLNSEEELSCYELLYEFAELTLNMATEYYADKCYTDVDEIFVRFHNSQTDALLYGIHILRDIETRDLEFYTVDLSDIEEDSFCDGDCEHCCGLNFEEDEEFGKPNYHFGFEW